MSSTPDSRDYFAVVATEWDALRAGFFTAEMRDAAIAQAALPPHAVVADVGTGTGFVLAGLVDKASLLVGYDESPEMLAVAARNLAAHDHVRLELADGDRLPAGDATYDAVFANMFLHHAPEPAAAIAEMARILKPGGRLVLTDLDRHSQVWMRAAMADRWLGFARDDVAAWLRAAGLHDVVVDCAAGTCDCTRDGEDVSLSVFIALGRR